MGARQARRGSRVRRDRSTGTMLPHAEVRVGRTADGAAILMPSPPPLLCSRTSPRLSLEPHRWQPRPFAPLRPHGDRLAPQGLAGPKRRWPVARLERSDGAPVSPSRSEDPQPSGLWIDGPWPTPSPLSRNGVGAVFSPPACGRLPRAASLQKTAPPPSAAHASPFGCGSRRVGPCRVHRGRKGAVLNNQRRH